MKRFCQNMRTGIVTATLLGLGNAGWDWALTGDAANLIGVVAAASILWNGLGIAVMLADSFRGTTGGR
jgi:hypothetical protein